MGVFPRNRGAKNLNFLTTDARHMKFLAQANIKKG